MVNFVIMFVLAILDYLIDGVGVLYTLYNFAVIIPNIAVGIRRMHDTDRSGWWILAPIVNLIYWAEDSKPGSNRFGPDTKTISS